MYFDQLLGLDPQNIDYLEKRGFCYIYINNCKAAIIDFNTALKLDSTKSSLYTYKGLAFQRISEYSLSNKCYLKAIELQPTLRQVYNSIGINFIFLRDTTQACSFFTKGVMLNDGKAILSQMKYCKLKPDTLGSVPK